MFKYSQLFHKMIFLKPEFNQDFALYVIIFLVSFNLAKIPFSTPLSYDIEISLARPDLVQWLVS